MSPEVLVAANIILQMTCSVAILTNLVAMAVFLRTAKLRVRYYAFVFNLVLSDFAFPALMIPVQYNRSVLFLPRVCLFAIELNILAVAVNRCLALTITPPARYDAMMTRGRLVVACLSIWVIAAVLYVPTALTDSDIIIRRLLRPGMAFFIMLLTGILYFVVFQKIAKYKPPLSSTPAVAGNEDQTTTRMRQIRRLMVTLTVILVTNFTCWIPFSFVNFADYFQWYPAATVSLARKFSLAFLVAHSAIDPFVYWWRIEEFREGLCQLVRCCRGRQSGLADTTDQSFDMQTVESAT